MIDKPELGFRPSALLEGPAEECLSEVKLPRDQEHLHRAHFRVGRFRFRLPTHLLEATVNAFHRKVLEHTPHLFLMVLDEKTKEVEIKQVPDVLPESSEGRHPLKLRTNLHLRTGQFQLHEALMVLGEVEVPHLRLWCPRTLPVQQVALYAGPKFKVRKSKLRDGSSHCTVVPAKLLLQLYRMVLHKEVYPQNVEAVKRPLVECVPRPAPSVSRLQSVFTNHLAQRSWGHCWYCGVLLTTDLSPKSKGSGTIDHQVPRSKGGRGGRNLVLACVPCNSQKGARSVDSYRSLKGLPRAAQEDPNWDRYFFAERLYLVLLNRLQNQPFPQGLQLQFAAQGGRLLQYFFTVDLQTLQQDLQLRRYPDGPGSTHLNPVNW